METLPSTSRWPGGVAALISASAHVVAIAVAFAPPFLPPRRDSERLLPALYLYAPDRHPAAPKEYRLPIPAAPGDPRAQTDVAPKVPLEGATSEPLRPQSIGLPLPGPAEVAIDSVFSAIAVDSAVSRYEWSSAPIYPDGLREQGTEGVVDAQFVVDTTGHVDLETVEILRSTHPAFRSSVETALAGMSFRPAWRGFRRVRQLVEQRFTFRLVHPPPASQS